MKKSPTSFPEVWERAVRMVLEQHGEQPSWPAGHARCTYSACWRSEGVDAWLVGLRVRADQDEKSR